MHLQTHLMSGWCVANLLPLGPRERLLCMIAATIPDLDGLPKIVSEDWYQRYHHILGHNLTGGVIISIVLAAFAKRHRVLTGITCLALFHLHLVMDYYGSGPGWPIAYFWPWDCGLPGSLWFCQHAWEFYSWQNMSAAAVMLAWTLGIAWRARRTPLEALMPRLDRQLVQLIAGPERAAENGPRQSAGALTSGRPPMS
ncbi:MAG TPA: hypothetical protein VK986_10790 [Tepidisphaeraceae bacterium]|nr:hypothetical protein [Tepidisphaeraceae bacterium]